MISEEMLIEKIKRLGIRPGSGNLKDYEAAKKIIAELATSPMKYEQLIRKTTGYINCSL